MFPKALDGAKVLYYTPKGNYGEICNSAGEIADHIKYLAICKYPNSNTEYYLFRCNEKYDVISDFDFTDIADCMEIAKSSYSGNITWIKTE